MWNICQPRHRGDILRIGRLRDGQPQSRLDMKTCRLAVRSQHIRILNLLKVPDAVQVNIILEEAAIGNVAGDEVELQGLMGLV